jgi:hypothetical protein
MPLVYALGRGLFPDVHARDGAQSRDDQLRVSDLSQQNFAALTH